MMRRIERALITVADKEGLAAFASHLQATGVELISTGGTARTLSDAGISARQVEDVTGFPEMMAGRVKTLHPRIHGGILARREVAEDRDALSEHAIATIDLVVVNLYPFEHRIRDGVSFAEAVEEIDIGGPALVRAAAKNHEHVAVVVNPARYPSLIDELMSQGGRLSAETRRSLAREAFARTAAYDAAISNWFGNQLDGDFPEYWSEQWRRIGELRYGENPHQRAAWYAREDGAPLSLSRARVRGERALSYNNLLDAAAATECAAALQPPACVIVKHTVPCGAAERPNARDAFVTAVSGDPVSAFGGIVAFTDPVDGALARAIASSDHFFEVICAPEFSPEAEDAIRGGARWGKKCRLVEGGRNSPRSQMPSGASAQRSPRWDLRGVPGGVLFQEPDYPVANRHQFTTVTRRAPTDSEWDDLLFAWRVIPHVRSNAIVLAKDRAVVGVGGGQPSRVDAVAIACQKAGERTAGAALASDAFFPFPDGVERAAEAGVTAILHPGGSIRDPEVTAAADRANLALVHTGERHFRH